MAILYSYHDTAGRPFSASQLVSSVLAIIGLNGTAGAVVTTPTGGGGESAPTPAKSTSYANATYANMSYQAGTETTTEPTTTPAEPAPTEPASSGQDYVYADSYFAANSTETTTRGDDYEYADTYFS